MSDTVEVPLLTVTVVVKVPMAVAPEAMVPEIRPVPVLMLRPVGRPVAA